jgi:uracil phosphoribosyltransferase
MTKYMPRNTIIASVFYSKQAVAELSQEIPNADIIVIGDPDALDENGMLVPGVGNLDVRLRA